MIPEQVAVWHRNDIFDEPSHIIILLMLIVSCWGLEVIVAPAGSRPHPPSHQAPSIGVRFADGLPGDRLFNMTV